MDLFLVKYVVAVLKNICICEHTLTNTYIFERFLQSKKSLVKAYVYIRFKRADSQKSYIDNILILNIINYYGIINKLLSMPYFIGK